ncbi:MAG: NUDIX hydrolase [bacterium]
MMDKPLAKTEIDWFGKRVRLELFDSVNLSKLNPITQVQAISFTDKDHIVLYKSGKGNYGCPGGHPESDESWEETLKRETCEEISAEVLKCGPIGYLKETNLETNEIKYFLRYWAYVKLIDEPINDPDDDARERFVFPIEEAKDRLDWGEIGQKLIESAINKSEI